MKWKIDDVPVFRAVVESAGISAAAEALGMPKSTVSTAISRLEQDLGIRLLDRNTRRMRLTGEGETFYRHCLLIMEQVDEADALMAGLTAMPAGRLTVALPGAFSQEILAPRLHEFRRRYPRVELDLIVTGHPVDVLRDQLDLAIVVGAQTDSELTQKTLLAGRLVWIASPDYLADTELGEGVDDLLAHIAICETRYALPRMPVRVSGEPAALSLASGVMRANDPVTVREAVLRGAGISFLPDRYCTQHLRRGELVEVFPNIQFEMSAATLSAVFPSRRLMSARLRVFLEFLEEVCRETGG